MSDLIFVYDTETTGLPNWKTPSGGNDQPHLVELGAVLVHVPTRQIVETLSCIIQPDGWEIPVEMSDIHGITTEDALQRGVPEKDALMQFLTLWGGWPRLAYNKTFDQRIIRIAMKRYCNEEGVLEPWADKEDHECAMQMARPIVDARTEAGKKKSPKLAEAYEFFMAEELEGAHSAMVDTLACLDVYWAIKDKF